MNERSLSLRLPVPGSGSVSALLAVPARCAAALVLAHGAGAGMHHPFMEHLADALCRHGVATLRFQFPSMEAGRRRPDPPAAAQAAVRAAVAAAATELPGVPLFVGGKSFGGRMASQAQAGRPMDTVLGLVFVGFPLHPAKRPSAQRAEHLRRVRVPMLFLQGTRDALADIDLMRATVDGLGVRATLAVFDDADHAFHVRAKSGSTDERVLEAIAAAVAAWTATVAR